MGLLSAIFPVLGQIGTKVAAHFFPDPADELKRAELAQAIPMAIMNEAATIEAAAADIVKTEAASSHWLAANWRPITALIFVGLIVARWFGYTAPNMSEPEYLSVYELVKIMIGGYVVSRGIEKIAPSIADAFKAGK
jgi:hypothetical protein